MSHQMSQTITVKRNISDTFKIWANFENFPKFVDGIESVTHLDDRTSRWVIHGPLGTHFSWNVETTTMVENQQLAWSSKDKAGHVTTSGQIMLEPLTENQTRVTVTVNYVPPAGLIGDVATEIIAGPEQRLAKGLRRFKEYAEKSAKPVG